MASSYTVTRTALMNASHSRVYDLIADFHNWVDWSPWEGLDPAMSRSYTGPDSGEGAHYAWEGNKEAGAGTMEITSASQERIVIDLRFLKPFPSTCICEFVLHSSDTGVEVTWRMTGELNFGMRIFTLIRPMDKMIGPDFEKGLASLKELAERSVR